MRKAGYRGGRRRLKLSVRIFIFLIMVLTASIVVEIKLRPVIQLFAGRQAQAAARITGPDCNKEYVKAFRHPFLSQIIKHPFTFRT